MSSSACDLWESSPKSYRKRYYIGEKSFDTPYTKFGKEFAEDIEKNPEKYPHIPKYLIPEFPIVWNIEGVPVKGYMDSFAPVSKSIIEYKTSLETSKQPWNAVKVRKWKQLPFYAMCVNEMFGTYDPVVKLIVMKTKWGESVEATKFGDKEFEKKTEGLVFTDDDPIIFEREIELWEVEKMKERLVRIATEVSEDYKTYQQG